MKLAAGNYWIFASAQLDTEIYQGQQFSNNTCASYYDGNSGYDTGSTEYDYRHNIMPVSITYIQTSGDSFDIYAILTNN